MRLALFILLLFSSAFCAAQTPGFEWAVATETGYTYRSAGVSIDLDVNGDVVVGGSFFRWVDLDPSAGVDLKTSLGRFDAYVMKVDSMGNYIWGKSFGGMENDMVRRIKTDHQGNIYIAGRFQDTVDFDPGPGVFKMHSEYFAGSDGFLLKLDASGNFLWAMKIGGQPGDHAQAVNIDLDNNVYFTGYYNGTVDFDPGPGVYNLTAQGNGDAYVMKLRPDGSFIWAKSYGGRNWIDVAFDVTTDDIGDVYVCGSFGDTVDFDPGTGVFLGAATGRSNSYLLKLDSAGNFIWATPFGASYTEALSLVVDSKGNSTVTGYYYHPGDFDHGAGVIMMDSVSPTNRFLIQFDRNGAYKWVKSSSGLGQDLFLDSLDNIYTVADFAYPIDLDFDTLTPKAISNGFRDTYIQKLDSNGNYVWARQIGNDDYDALNSLVLDKNFNIYACGMFYSDSIDPDFSADTNWLRSDAMYESFIMKVNQCVNSYVDTLTACDSLQWRNGVVYTENTDSPLYKTYNSKGCDSLVELNLEIFNSSMRIDTIQSCTPLTWIDGNTYVADTTNVQIHFTSSRGCDSLVSLDFKRMHSSSFIDSNRACQEFTWIDGITYSVSNQSAEYVLTNTQGCDSTVYLDLNLVSLGDMSILQVDSFLHSNASASSFQWLDCGLNYQVIDGENDANYIAPRNGNYAVEVNVSGCTDTSECIAIRSYIPPVYRNFTCTSIYPNPSKGVFNLELGEMENTELRLFDMHGKDMGYREVVSDPVHQIELDVPNAMYILEIKAENGSHHCRIEINR